MEKTKAELVSELEELRRNEELYRNLVMGAPLGILVREGGVVRFANDAIASLLEIPPEEAQTESLEETLGWVHPDDRAFIADLIQKRAAAVPDLPAQYDVRVVTSTGETRWVTMFVRVMRTDGPLPTVVTCLTDITERKEAEEAERRERERAQRYLGIVDVIVVAIDTDGIVTLINQKGCEILGYTEAEIVGKNWFENFIPEWCRTELLTVPKRLLDGDAEGGIRHENPILTKAGEERLIAWHNTVIRDMESAVSGYLSSGQDITDRRRLEAQLIQSQKMEAAGQLAGGVAHDMNNVLTMIMAAASILDEEIKSDDPLAEDVETIISACRRGRGLTRALLGFARKGLPIRDRFDVGEVLTEVVKLLMRTSYQRVAIEANIDPYLADVGGDRAQVTQVLMNICLNAIDAIGDRGSLTVNAENVVFERSGNVGDLCRGNYVRLSFVDTGSGMSEEARSRAFEPFFTTKPPGKGTGLGLAIAYGVVKSHGGDLAIESELGEGTTVSIHLPAAEPEDEHEEAIVPQKVQHLSATVLLVDDEPRIRTVAQRILEKNGCYVIPAANGKEAVALYSQNADAIDMVVLDLVMPVMDGADAFIEIRKIDPKAKVLVASGYVEDDKKTAVFVELGVSGYLQKPYTGAELIEKVLQALQRR